MRSSDERAQMIQREGAGHNSFLRLRVITFLVLLDESRSNDDGGEQEQSILTYYGLRLRLRF